MLRRIVRTCLTTGALFAAATGARAQTDMPYKPLHARASGGLLIASPVGEFNDYVGTGWGLGGTFILHLDRAGIIGLRADAGFLNYGNEKRQVCLSETVGCRIQVDLTTSNNIVFGSIGPELTAPAGPVQPYVNASIGFSYFATTSSLHGSNNSGSDPIASTTNFDDGTFAWQAGGGLRVPITAGRLPVQLDVGARYHDNGRVQYLTRGSITDNPDGSITLHPLDSQTNLVTFLIGVSLGVRW